MTLSYQQQHRQPTAHCQLSRAQRKVDTYSHRLPRCHQVLLKADRRLARYQTRLVDAQTLVVQLQAHYQQLLADNDTNAQSIRATWRLDAGFASRENIAWLIEMGYDLYTRGRSTTVRDTLRAAVTLQTPWDQVGSNASMTAWSNTTVDDHSIYSLDVTLTRYQTGDTLRQSVLLHYGQADVTADLSGWF